MTPAEDRRRRTSAKRDRGAGAEADGESPYPPIRDYALIGDCHGAALVSRSGSVDWCTLGRFDADPVFCRILDVGRGGHLSVRPRRDFRAERAYLPGTNILRTLFHTEEGRVSVTDFMPVGRMPGSGTHDYVTLAAPLWLVRIVEGLDGRVPLELRYRPSVDFARREARLEPTKGGVAVEGGPHLRADLEWSVDEGTAVARTAVEAGDRRHLVVSASPVPAEGLAERLERSLEITRAFWDEWSDYCRYDGPYRKAVERSALVLKALTYAPSGAIVAAPTTSLPERIGGVRNWDYRFCWLRDASFTLYALAFLGYGGEADDFSTFLMRACGPRIQVLYGIGGETDLPESTLDHLEGYRGSRPVRVGNAAAHQLQLDIYGEVLDWAHLYRKLGTRFGSDERRLLEELADFVAGHWQEPGEGIWEARGVPRHYVYGKVMCWTALDRAVELLDDAPNRDEWARAREAVRASVLEHGVDPEGGHLRQAYEEESPDAATLLAPMVGFPMDREVLERTVEVVERRLRTGPFVHRYLSDDGLPGREGAFLICSFWLVDALLALDRAAEARELFEELLERANDVGLYAEEVDPATGTFLGNFPQAFTHLALVQAAANLQLYEEKGGEGLCCSHADRAGHVVEAVRGIRGLWAALKKTGRVGRLLSSRDSVMPEEWRAESAPEDWRMAALGWPIAPRVVLSPFGRSAGERVRGDREREEKAFRGPTL